MNHSRSWSPLVVVMALGTLILAVATPTNSQIFDTDTKVDVDGLSTLLARSSEPPDVLLASVQKIFHDEGACCEKNSALESSVAAADPLSLKDVASKLQGRHLLSDGRPIQVTAEFWPVDAANSGTVISALTDKHALLMVWDSHLYVVYGAIYQWVWVGNRPEGGAKRTVIRKFLLWDPRPENTHNLEFNREKDDLGKVQGLLLLQFKLQ